MANTNTNTTADTGTGTDTDTDPYAYLFAPIEGRYPVTDPVVWACHISRWTDTKWLAGVLADLCPGHTFTLDPAPYQGEYTAELQFNTAAAANRCMAIMNTHPALEGHGITFCRPRERSYPQLRELWTRREVEPAERLAGAETQNREEWMPVDPIWPCYVPSPGAVYDDLVSRSYGPIHHVTVEVPEFRRWDVMVQFFDKDGAAAFDDCRELCGWCIDVFALESEFRAHEAINAYRQYQGLPPLEMPPLHSPPASPSPRPSPQPHAGSTSSATAGSRSSHLSLSETSSDSKTAGDDLSVAALVISEQQLHVPSAASATQPPT